MTNIYRELLNRDFMALIRTYGYAPLIIVALLLAAPAAANSSGCGNYDIQHGQDRFWVSVDFWPQPTEPHVAKDFNGACPITHSADPGGTRIFWFFSPDNLEVMVKVLDGCAINNHYWVFAAGLTTIPWRLNVQLERELPPGKHWYIEPGERVIKKRVYQDLPPQYNRWSPDLFHDRETGRLYHRLNTRDPADLSGRGYTGSEYLNYFGAQQVAETNAFRCPTQ